jgi:hypothetical protein
MKYTPKIRCRHVRLVISEQVLARWWRLVAFMKVRNLHHLEMCEGTFCIIVLLIVAMAATGAMWSE